MTLSMRRAQPSESRELAEWIRQNHYLGSLPPAYAVALEFTARRDRVGGMLLGLPARGYDQSTWLQLSRVFFVDGTAPNVESQGLSMMRRHVRVWMQGIRMLVAYSDPSVGHDGVIYKADGWAFDRYTRGGGQGWSNRSGRSAGGGRRTPKMRWLRTP